ncbi:MAG: RnfABCDGE type electron transport complex subunit B [Treponema sp.]|jgi:RnfABCDGE-type electron transport complex B subunit|nr:RnfABCDGE type electron transport complex subunit B [Treponema sp.]
MSDIIILSSIFALALAFALGISLGFFKQFFAVEEDPLISQIREALPGANCGACGFPGCDGYAAAVAGKNAGASGCPVGGKAAAGKIAALVGGNAEITPSVAVLACNGTKTKAVSRGEYIGVKKCRASKISTGSIKACSWGCQGFGDCVAVCKFDAISMGDQGLPVIDHSKCTGCRACSIECPQHIIRIIPKDLKGAIPLCSNLNVLKTMVTKNCKSGCIKCELCVKNCPEQCLKMANGIPVVDYTKCTNCGTCVGKCPIKVLKLFSK